MAQMNIRMANQFFESWMKQSGQVKQLQLYLAVAVLMIIFLLSQLMNNAVQSPDKSKFKNNQQIEAGAKGSSAAQSKVNRVSEQEVEAFTRDYMTKFFSTEDSSYDFIKAHTVGSMFVSTIAPEINARREQKITSVFKINNLYVEVFSPTQIKAYCFGRETFPEGDYEDRKFVVEMIVDVPQGKEKDLKVSSIPVFRVES